MGKEEQDEEREILASIYPDEFTEISPDTFSILLPLDLPSSDNDPPSAILTTIQLPPDYPSLAPTLSLSFPPPPIPRPPHLSLPADTPSLLSPLTAPIEESLGTAMIFTLLSTLKETTEALITSRIEAVQHEAEAEARAAERKENEKFEGERVTRERFLEWREKFRAEKERVKEGEKAREEEEGRGKGRRPLAGVLAGGGAVGGGMGEEGKLTGRMLWERGLVGKGAEGEGEDEDEEEGLGKGVAELRVLDE